MADAEADITMSGSGPLYPRKRTFGEITHVPTIGGDLNTQASALSIEVPFVSRCGDAALEQF
jgi:hypothetical protein